jgi:8-oxo-dGTP pyrophosphatase MutT (NUDIX family)
MIVKSENSKNHKYFHILARGIIIDDGYFLVAKLKSAKNTFLPGGHMDFNEDLKMALKREIFEEIGMDCIIGKYIGCLEAQWTENNDYNQEINHIFLVNEINKNMKIKSKESHLDIYWVKICEKEMEKENLLPLSMRTIVMDVIKNNNVNNYISEIL